MFSEYLDHFSNVLHQHVITDKDNRILLPDVALNDIIKSFQQIKQTGKTMYLIGNGGSSGIISHTAVDLINSCKMKAYPITDHSLITCMANDNGYENVFSKPLSTIFHDGDGLIAVSSSGASQNIINAVHSCASKKPFILTLSGFSENNPLRRLGNFNLWLPITDYGIVEIGHALLLHWITDSFKALINK